jgi:hypothetical protein
MGGIGSMAQMVAMAAVESMKATAALARVRPFSQGTPRRGSFNRTAERFAIGPNSHPRKVQRGLARGGGNVVDMDEAAARHVHPRHKR